MPRPDSVPARYSDEGVNKMNYQEQFIDLLYTLPAILEIAWRMPEKKTGERRGMGKNCCCADASGLRICRKIAEKVGAYPSRCSL